MKERLIHVDITRGIAILLVVFGHNWIVSHYKGELLLVIYSFHVPAFFFLSGVFFNASNSFFKTVAQKADALLKPYFVFLILTEIAIYLLTEHKNSLNESLIGIAYANGNLLRFAPLWFLPNLFAVTIFAWLYINIFRLSRTHIWKHIPVLLIMLAFGVSNLRYFWGRANIIYGIGPKELGLPFAKIWGLPFGLDILLITAFFFLMGYLLRNQVESIQFNKWTFFICLIAFTLIHVFSDNAVDLNVRKYESPLVATVTALLGIYLILSLSILISSINGLSTVLSYLGRNSLIIYLFHTPFQEYAFILLGKLGGWPIWNAVLAYMFGVCMPLVSLVVIQKWKLLRLLILPLKHNEPAPTHTTSHKQDLP